METQVKSTQAFVVIAHFINAGKKKKMKRHGLIPQGASLLTGEMGCLNELPDTMSGDGKEGGLWTHRYLRYCPTLS